MTDRPTISARVEAAVLFNNDHTCCICRQRWKDVQIHHIDGDRTNNAASNFAVLCLNCHSVVTGTRGLGKRYSVLEVSRYKRNWESLVRTRRGQIGLIRPPHGESETKALRIEIRKNLLYLSVTTNQARVREILDLLDFYRLFENDVSWLLDRLHELVPYIFRDKTAGLLAEYVTFPFFHFMLSDGTKMLRNDRADLEKAIGICGALGGFGAIYGNVWSIRKSLKALSWLADVADVHHLSSHKRKIVSEIKSIQKDIKESTLGARVKNSLSRSSSSYLRRVRGLSINYQHDENTSITS